jgi:hypothetical protein
VSCDTFLADAVMQETVSEEGRGKQQLGQVGINLAEHLNQIPEAAYSLAREKKKPRKNWRGLQCQTVYRVQHSAPLLSFVSHLLTMRSDRKSDVVALEPYSPKRIHQSGVCRIQHAMTRL